jgi:hypothetical protein
MTEARKRVTQFRLQPFRRAFYRERIRHWLRLVAGRWRMAKDRTVLRSQEWYLQRVSTVLLIQKAVRGLIARKTDVPLLKFCFRQYQAHLQIRIHSLKFSIWQRCRIPESDMLQTAGALAEQLHFFQHTQHQGKRIKGFKTDKDLTAYIRSMQKAESRDRIQQQRNTREGRIRMLTL